MHFGCHWRNIIQAWGFFHFSSLHKHLKRLIFPNMSHQLFSLINTFNFIITTIRMVLEVQICFLTKQFIILILGTCRLSLNQNLIFTLIFIRMKLLSSSTDYNIIDLLKWNFCFCFGRSLQRISFLKKYGHFFRLLNFFKDLV